MHDDKFDERHCCCRYTVWYYFGLLSGEVWEMRMRLTAALAAAAICLTALTGGASALYFDGQEARKAGAHAVAETARAYGYTETSAVIQTAQADWWQAQAEIDEQVDLLARVIWFEAGSSWISDRQQQLVACVVLNRCADPRFPATISGVVYQRGQYSCASRLYSISKMNIPARCYANARLAAYGAVDCPVNVIYQAAFCQGTGVYEKGYRTFFCYG